MCNSLFFTYFLREYEKRSNTPEFLGYTKSVQFLNFSGKDKVPVRAMKARKGSRDITTLIFNLVRRLVNLCSSRFTPDKITTVPM